MGIAFINGSGIEVYRTPGRLKDLRNLLPSPLPAMTIGIGHTRWATHGEPSVVNAHPHTVHGVSVVHNGLIENYRELKEELMAAGCVFSSRTDTEVVPQLIAQYLAGVQRIAEAIRRAVARLRGIYALGIVYEGAPDTLFAVRNGSPLIVGTGGDAQYLASDVPALLPHTRSLLTLEDRHMTELRGCGIVLTHIDSPEPLPLEGKAATVTVTAAMAEKQGHEHFMLKEIYEQSLGVHGYVAGVDRRHGPAGSSTSTSTRATGRCGRTRATPSWCGGSGCGSDPHPLSPSPPCGEGDVPARIQCVSAFQ